MERIGHFQRLSGRKKRKKKRNEISVVTVIFKYMLCLVIIPLSREIIYSILCIPSAGFCGGAQNSLSLYTNLVLNLTWFNAWSLRERQQCFFHSDSRRIQYNTSNSKNNESHSNTRALLKPA